MKQRRPLVRMEMVAPDEAEVSIFGPIGGDWWGGGVTLDDLKAVFDEVKGAAKIRVLLNSEGGDAFDGMAMYNLLSKVRDRLTVEVLGFAASAASVIALAGHELVIDEGAYLMIHEPWGVTVGPADDHRQTADLLDKMTGQFADLYAEHSTLSREAALEAMKAETWYTAAEAVEAGFATAVGEEAEVEARSVDLAQFKYKRVPGDLGAQTATDHDVPRTAKGLELLLRESGYSRSEALGIAARGAKAILPESESRAEAEPAAPASSVSECPESGGVMLARMEYEVARASRLRKGAA